MIQTTLPFKGMMRDVPTEEEVNTSADDEQRSAEFAYENSIRGIDLTTIHEGYMQRMAREYYKSWQNRENGGLPMSEALFVYPQFVLLGAAKKLVNFRRSNAVVDENIVDQPELPKASHSERGKQLALKLESNKPLPAVFEALAVAAVTLYAKTGKHYRDVESGLFDKAARE